MNKSFFAALMLGIEGVLFFVFVMPRYRELMGARDSLAERRVLLSDTRAAQQSVIDLSTEYDANAITIAQVLRALPQQRQYDYVTESIRAASVNSGMELSSFVVGEAQKGKGDFQAIPVKMELRGRYPELIIFLGSLERSLRLYDITKLDVAEAGSDGAGSLVVTIQATAYSLQ